ncbi:MAG: glycoside hydrolase family 43 protein [Phycisphaerae bacterium]
MPETIGNPILPGFHPDPSICRVGDDFYIANSTFEWFPGVRIHHSRDLKHWRLIGGALDRVSQLDMRGNPDSGGIWAPCLSWADGRFWLIYTNVRSVGPGYKDTPNFLVTSENIEGPWSEPVYLNSSGFDPSLFHDDDGRKWLVNMVWDHRPGRHPFAGTLMQEYCVEQQKLVGPIRNICPGKMGTTEGPHLYKKDGWYYLMLAEGGTGVNHMVSVARSRQLEGPYEFDPVTPMLTARKTDARLQKAGHGSLVDTPTGQWYLVHLASRPIGPEKRCMLGRETALQKVIWTEDGWLRLADGGTVPADDVPAPDLPTHPFDPPAATDDFDQPKLSGQLNTFRVPPSEDWLSLTERPGWLRLRGRESLVSLHEQSLVARRVEAFTCQAETKLEFAPETFQQMAGLTAIYNTQMWYYLHVSCDAELGRCLRLGVCDNGKFGEAGDPVALDDGPVWLKGLIADGQLQFAFSGDGRNWQDFGPVLDATKLSDDYVNTRTWGFTGAFFGLCCQDLSGAHLAADFDFLRVENG